MSKNLVKKRIVLWEKPWYDSRIWRVGANAMIVRYLIAMKKSLSGLLALTLAVTLCAGCAGEPKTAAEPPSGIYYDVTGIDPRNTACTVGDIEFPAEMYLYCLAYTCSSLEYDVSMYHAYFGAYEELFDEEENLLWDAAFMDGLTLSEYARQDAQKNLLFYAAIESKAKELGIELTEDDKAGLEAEFADTVESMGGQEAFEENLEMMGISRESFDRISGDAKLVEKMAALTMEEGSALYVPPEEYASYADHILLATTTTTDTGTSEPVSEEEIAEKYATAQDLLAQLQAAEDVEALFDQLADEYSEDPGRAEEKGYLVTANSNFVEEFLNAALSMQPGEISDIVESTYGYHILYRRNLTDMLTSEDFAGLAEDYLYTRLESEMDQLTMESTDEINAVDAGKFYTGYNAKVEEIIAAREAENPSDSGTDAEDGTGTADSADGSTDAADGTGDADGNE